MKKLIVTMVVAMVLVFCGSAMALDLTMGNDFYLDNFYDIRIYDESYPDDAPYYGVGGWSVGITLVNQIGQVKDINVEGEKTEILMKQPFRIPMEATSKNF